MELDFNAATYNTLRRMVDDGRIDGTCVEALADNRDEAEEIKQRLPEVSPA